MEQLIGTEEKKEKKESMIDKIAGWKKRLEDKEASLEEVLLEIDYAADSFLSYPFASLAENFVFADKSGLSHEEMLFMQMNRCLGIPGDPDDGTREKIMNPLPLIAGLKMVASQARAKGEHKKADETGLEIIKLLEEENARLDKLLLHYSNL